MIRWKFWLIIWLEPLDKVGIGHLFLPPSFLIWNAKKSPFPHLKRPPNNDSEAFSPSENTHQERWALRRKHHRRSGPKRLPRTSGALQNNSSWAVTKGTDLLKIRRKPIETPINRDHFHKQLKESLLNNYIWHRNFNPINPLKVGEPKKMCPKKEKS